MSFTPARIFILMCVAFVMYSAIIYTMPLRDAAPKYPAQQIASQGKLTWQKYNCQACHQLYGLGGYLGPDLTNIISSDPHSEAIIRSVVRSGTKQMPAFEMSEEEVSGLIQFLRYANSHGSADPRNFEVTNLGIIQNK